MTAPVIVWFCRDLRLADQAALAAAAAQGPVIPVYILDDETPKYRKMGGASRWWLHHSLADLESGLAKYGSRLILRRGSVAAVLVELVKSTGAHQIHALHHYEPWWRNAEKAVAKSLHEATAGQPKLVLHHGNHLLPPTNLTTGSGGRYKIFTPFYKSLLEQMPPAAPLPPTLRLDPPADWPASDRLSQWQLSPTRPNWARSFSDYWTPGERGAAAMLDDFADKINDYDEGRNLPSQPLVSRLSPHLHFGEISPATIWQRLANPRENAGQNSAAAPFLRQLIWRDYAANIIEQFPQYGSLSYRENMRDLPWRDLADPQVAADFAAWTKGETGYPIVDAGMRQLWATGWMHNRVRMIAASFLIKHLLIDWRQGEKWFWDTLVDADYGANSVNWQWVAGTGVDSNMFVRIMAPLSQSEKFDAGDYIRAWVPQLSAIDDPYIHDPEEFGCRPRDYPAKIIAHRQGRERALAAYHEVR